MSINDEMSQTNSYDEGNDADNEQFDGIVKWKERGHSKHDAGNERRTDSHHREDM